MLSRWYFATGPNTEERRDSRLKGRQSIYMRRIYPLHSCRFLNWLQIRQVHSHSFAVTPHQHTFQLLICAGVDLLMWYIGRNTTIDQSVFPFGEKGGRKGNILDKIPRPSLSSELQFLSPSHTGFAFQHIDYRFQVSVVVSSCFCVGVDVDCSCLFRFVSSDTYMSFECSYPKLLSSYTSKVYCCFSVHSWCLRCVAVERIGGDDSDSFVFPAILRCWWMWMVVVVGVRNL